MLDSIDAGYFNKDLSLFANPARIAVISLLGGKTIDCNLLKVLSKNVTLLDQKLRIQSNFVIKMITG
ncbi:MAG: hypothetical protein CMD54_02990 [Gammaproteobacteria bacterium]|nr:hypothetical protein [Gammaproteobacteria bacterium]HAN80465.1 hypothetical protein [Gammaproteobacteria bacterium]